MSTKDDNSEMAEGEERNDWHGLPAMIGDAITDHDEGVVRGWADYLVRKDENGDIRIYRVVSRAESRDELEDEGDFVTEIWEHIEAGVEIGSIQAPDGGWGTEVEPIAESIFGGFE